MGNVAGMEEELRGEFHRELEEMDISVAALLGLLPDAIRTATEALLVDSGDLVAKTGEWSGLVDGLFGGVTITVESIVARQAPVARDLRFLLACVRLVPTLYDSVDLIADIAAPGAAGVAMGSTDRARAMVRDAGERAAGTWTAVETLWSVPELGMAAVHQRAARTAEGCSALIAEQELGDLEVGARVAVALSIRSLYRLSRHAATAAEVISRLGPRRSAAP